MQKENIRVKIHSLNFNFFHFHMLHIKVPDLDYDKIY